MIMLAGLDGASETEIVRAYVDAGMSEDDAKVQARIILADIRDLE